MTLDVVIPVYKPDRKFITLLARLNRQRRKPEKIVLMVTADTGEKVGRATVRKWISRSRIPVECHILSKEEFDHGGTRNKGIGFCKSDVVLCMTQDAVPADEFMTEELLKPFEGEFCGAKDGKFAGREILVSYGRQLPVPFCRVIEGYTRRFNYPKESRIKTVEDTDTLGVKTFFASNVCAAYRRGLFLEQGGFPEKTIFNEDMIFAGRAVKAGYGIAYAAKARVFHSHNLSGREQFHRNFDLAVSQVEHPEVFEGLRSEGEGVKLVKATAAYLINNGNGRLLPLLFWVSACKYAGYFLGKRFRRLPGWLVRSCSMNKRYWGDR
ncbi:MAG: glycosyltransferase [Lachnospiraceae bacterium]|nr:glycosyltransferase [Lachnospiraceae bacterium]